MIKLISVVLLGLFILQGHLPANSQSITCETVGREKGKLWTTKLQQLSIIGENQHKLEHLYKSKVRYPDCPDVRNGILQSEINVRNARAKTREIEDRIQELNSYHARCINYAQSKKVS